MAKTDAIGDKSETPNQQLGAEDPIVDACGFLMVCTSADGNNRLEALDDLNFLVGNHWPATIERQREIDQRPCLTINKLPTFLHQVTNDQRMNVPSIKISPVDSKADVKTAEIYQGLVRHIEYSSNADYCYDTAVNSAAAIGFGYFRLVTDYCDPKSFDQDIKFKRIRNAFTVYFDPMSMEPDGSDQRRCLLSERLTLADFRKQYPKAQLPSSGLPTGSGDPTRKDWYGADFIRVAEFYRIEEEPATLIETSLGETMYKDELPDPMPEGMVIKRERESTRPKVMWYKLTAIEVLESTEIKCKWIPVFPVYGDEVDIDGNVVRSGIIRNAKDPSKMYDFWMTSATEEIALRPKTPYIGAEGQFEGYEDDWNSANVKNFSYLEYKPVELNGSLAPPPVRQLMSDIPDGVLTMAMHANDNIKATTGLFDSSLGAMGNARSGAQERSQQRQGDVANFHFTDNLNRTVRHVGRCLISMIPSYYDAKRTIRVMGEDDSIKPVEINQPQVDAAGQIEKILHDMTVGEYDLTVKAGPNYSTLRQEAQDGMIELGGKWPKLMDVAGDKIIRAMDWPGATEIADRVKKTIPPEFTKDEDEGEEQPPMVQTPKGPIPVDQASQMLQEMDQQIQQMGQELQEAKAGIPKAQLDAQSRETIAKDNNDRAVRIAEINAVSAQDVAELNGLIKILIAKIPPPADLEGQALESGAGA